MKEEQGADSVLAELCRCNSSRWAGEAPAHTHKYLWQVCASVLMCCPLSPLLQSAKAHERGWGGAEGRFSFL